MAGTGESCRERPSIKPRDLPLVGCISNWDKDFYGSFADLSQKKVLCIGFSEAEAEQLVEKHRPAQITILTHWAGHVDAKAGKFPLVFGDITKRTQFDDSSFDAVLTLSVLEHLLELNDAFDEMARLVKNGGAMLHLFGPSWSCAYGHHIYQDKDDKLLNFSLWQMPAHMHLLCSREEIVNFYGENGYPESVGRTANRWFFETPIINRVFYDEYMKIFDRFQIDRMELMYNDLPREHVERLRKTYPGRRDFSTYGGKYKLIVRK